MSDKSQQINSNVVLNKKSYPELLVFHFQPSLKENTEVIINFDKKYLIFKSMYPHSAEPPPPMRRKDYEKFIDKRKPLKPYFTNLSDKELKNLNILINSFFDEDYQRIEELNIDGISYNFSILFSNKDLKNGFISNDKTENQEKLVKEIISLLHKTNKYEENKPTLQYY
ncbi:hypothetical protein [Chryseobacterium luquanense]|uniref:Uncharacterized protein n=1 Tax=Chryseobacterium luquanense TaxID=2983766 RepID=A0ABT3Y1C4_9FLAO|nr:hypothetical protein [Chryseobacterium luquanense]MCX8531942.1 hypothetical protein [Chryseobacterium luquanense]